MPLEIRESREAEVLVLELIGRLDTKTSGALEKSVATHLGAGQRRFILDLTGMEYVSSAGLRIFLMLAKKVSGTGGLALYGLSPQVREVFDIAGFTRLFALAATRAEALAGGGPMRVEVRLKGLHGPADAAPRVGDTLHVGSDTASFTVDAGDASVYLGIGELIARGHSIHPVDATAAAIAPEVRELARRAAALLAPRAAGKDGEKGPGGRP